jgi:hypothetical protein
MITSETSIFERYAVEHFSSVKRYDVRYGGLMTGAYIVEL